MCYTTGDIWAVKNGKELWFRNGCNDDKPEGTGWRQIKGRNVIHIDCGFRGRLYYISDNQAGYVAGIDETTPWGNNGWKDSAYYRKHLTVKGNSDGSAIYTLNQ